MTRTINTITVNFVIYDKLDKKVREQVITIPFKKVEDLDNKKYLDEIASNFGVLSETEMLVSCERISGISTGKYYMDDATFYLGATPIG